MLSIDEAKKLINVSKLQLKSIDNSTQRQHITNRIKLLSTFLNNNQVASD